MECDGCFDLDETFVLNSENDSLELENLNILMPLFEETALLDTEAVHVIIETQTNEQKTQNLKLSIWKLIKHLISCQKAAWMTQNLLTTMKLTMHLNHGVRKQQLLDLGVHSKTRNCGNRI